MLGTTVEEAVRRAAEQMTEAAAITLIDGLLDAEGSLRSGADARLALEILLIKAARPAGDRTLDGALRRIEALEGGAPARAAAPLPPPVATEPAPLPTAAAPPTVPEAPVVTTPPAPAGASEEAPPWDAPAAPPAPPAPITPVAEPAEPESFHADDEDASSAPPAPVSPPAPPVVERPAVPPAAEQPPAPPVEPAPAEALPAPPRAPAGDLDLPIAELHDVWAEALSRVSPKLRSMLTPAAPLRIERGAIVIAFPSASQFQKSQADREQNRHELAAALSTALGADVRVVLETSDDGGPPPALPVAAPVAAPTPAPVELDPNIVHSADYDGELDDPHTREEEFVRSLVETLDASEEEIG
jgi:hypothetical protein